MLSVALPSHVLTHCTYRNRTFHIGRKWSPATAPNICQTNVYKTIYRSVRVKSTLTLFTFLPSRPKACRRQPQCKPTPVLATSLAILNPNSLTTSLPSQTDTMSDELSRRGTKKIYRPFSEPPRTSSITYSTCAFRTTI